MLEKCNVVSEQRLTFAQDTLINAIEDRQEKIPQGKRLVKGMQHGVPGEWGITRRANMSVVDDNCSAVLLTAVGRMEWTLQSDNKSDLHPCA
jgi:hypothetical protein